MLRGLILENFKAFGGRRVIPIKPITLIFGPNSAGKSAIIQSLLLLRQSAQHTWNRNSLSSLRLRGEDVDLGSFSNVVFKHDSDLSIEITPIFNHGEAFIWATGIPDQLPFEVSSQMGIGVRFKGEAQSDRVSLIAQPIYMSDLSEAAAEMIRSDRALNRASEILTSESGRFELAEAWYLMNTVEPVVNEASGLWQTILDLIFASSPNSFEIISAEMISNELTNLNHADTDDVMARLVQLRERDLQLFIATIQESVKEDLFVTRGMDLEDFRLRGTTTDLGEDGSNISAIVRKIANSSVLEEFPDLGKLAQDLVRTRSTFLDGLRHVGPLRDYPTRHYIYSGGEPLRYDKAGQFLPDALFSNPSMVTLVNEALISFGIRYRLELSILSDLSSTSSDVYQLRLVDTVSDTKSTLVDVGFGLSQVLPVIASIVSIEEGTTLLIEQPELHLHPRLQAEIADLVIQNTLASHMEDEARTVLVETHSEQIVLRLLRRIRETSQGRLPDGFPAITPGDVSIIYVHPMEDGSGSIPISIELDESGELMTAWPGGFFEEGFHERFA